MDGMPTVVKFRGEEYEIPDLETIQEWLMEDGGCEALDGCWTEMDGVCPHGFPSWLRALGIM